MSKFQFYIYAIVGITIYFVIGVYVIYKLGSLGNARSQQPEVISPLPKYQKAVATPTPVDKRKEKLESFLFNYNSNLYQYAGDFIEVADKYKLDYRLLPSISGVESTFGKFTPHSDKYNIFGWGCTASTACSHFGSYRDAMERVAIGLSTARAYASYRATGSTSELAYSYNGVSPEQWNQKVTYFMEEIK